MHALQIVYETQNKDFAKTFGNQRFGTEICIKDTKMTLVDMKSLVYLLENTSTCVIR